MMIIKTVCRFDQDSYKSLFLISPCVCMGRGGRLSKSSHPSTPVDLLLSSSPPLPHFLFKFHCIVIWNAIALPVWVKSLCTVPVFQFMKMCLRSSWAWSETGLGKSWVSDACGMSQYFW